MLFQTEERTVETRRDGRRAPVIRIDYREANGNTSPTSTHQIRYTYDPNGNMLARNDSAGNTNFTYDDLNRMLKEGPEAPSSTIDYRYDPAGNLVSVAASDEPAAVTYAYDSTNLLTRLVDQQGKETTFEYDDHGKRTKTVYPNGITMQSEWDASKRLKWIRSYKGATSSCPTTPSACLTSFTYSYTSPSGADTTTRYEVTDKDGNKTTYSYDDISRLTRARTTTPSGSTELEDYEYSYDENGNMMTKTLTGSAITNEAVKYRYNDANELTCSYTGTTCDALQSSTTTYGYDLNGNLESSSRGLSLAYNFKNQTTSVTPPGAAALTMEYADATSDRRVVAGDQRMAYNQLGLSSQAPNNGVPHTTWFVRDNEGTLVSMLDRNDATKDKYYVFDGLGSVVATTDGSGNVIRRYRYEPYGKEINPSSTDDNPWRYASGYFDKQTGMLKFGTRYYMPELARWTQQDPESGKLNDPITLNRYQYGGCNPANNVDPTGRSHQDYGAAFEMMFDFATGCVPGAETGGLLGTLTPFPVLGPAIGSALGCFFGGLMTMYGAPDSIFSI